TTSQLQGALDPGLTALGDALAGVTGGQAGGGLLSANLSGVDLLSASQPTLGLNVLSPDPAAGQGAGLSLLSGGQILSVGSGPGADSLVQGLAGDIGGGGLPLPLPSPGGDPLGGVTGLVEGL